MVTLFLEALDAAYLRWGSARIHADDSDRKQAVTDFEQAQKDAANTPLLQALQAWQDSTLSTRKNASDNLLRAIEDSHPLDLNARLDFKGNTLLHRLAVIRGSGTLIQAAIAAGATGCLNQDLETALWLALNNEYEENVCALVQRDARVSFSSTRIRIIDRPTMLWDTDGRALVGAIGRQHQENKPTEHSCFDNHAPTPLQMALYKGLYAAARQLLDDGAALLGHQAQCPHILDPLFIALKNLSQSHTPEPIHLTLITSMLMLYAEHKIPFPDDEQHYNLLMQLKRYPAQVEAYFDVLAGPCLPGRVYEALHACRPVHIPPTLPPLLHQQPSANTPEAQPDHHRPRRRAHSDPGSPRKQAY